MAISLKIRLKISTIQFVDALKRLYPFLSEDSLRPVMQHVALRINDKKVTLFATDNISLKLVHFDNALTEPLEDVTIHISPITVQEIIDKKNIQEGDYIDLLVYPVKCRKRYYQYNLKTKRFEQRFGTVMQQSSSSTFLTKFSRNQRSENIEEETMTCSKVELKINRVGQFEFADTINGVGKVKYEQLTDVMLQKLRDAPEDFNTFGVLKKDLLAILQKGYYTHYYCVGNKTDVLRYGKRNTEKDTYTFGFLQTLYNNFCQERAATNIVLADMLLKKVLDSLPKEVEFLDIHTGNGGKLVYVSFPNQRAGNMHEQVFLMETDGGISVTKLNEMNPATEGASSVLLYEFTVDKILYDIVKTSKTTTYELASDPFYKYLNINIDTKGKVVLGIQAPYFRFQKVTKVDKAYTNNELAIKIEFKHFYDLFESNKVNLVVRIFEGGIAKIILPNGGEYQVDTREGDFYGISTTKMDKPPLLLTTKRAWLHSLIKNSIGFLPKIKIRTGYDKYTRLMIGVDNNTLYSAATDSLVAASHSVTTPMYVNNFTYGIEQDMAATLITMLESETHEEIHLYGNEKELIVLFDEHTYFRVIERDFSNDFDVHKTVKQLWQRNHQYISAKIEFDVTALQKSVLSCLKTFKGTKDFAFTHLNYENGIIKAGELVGQLDWQMVWLSERSTAKAEGQFKVLLNFLERLSLVLRNFKQQNVDHASMYVCTTTGVTSIIPQLQDGGEIYQRIMLHGLNNPTEAGKCEPAFFPKQETEKIKNMLTIVEKNL